MRAHGFGPRQQRLVAVDVALQLGALEAEACRVDEHRRVAGVDQGGLDPAEAGNVEQVDMIARRKGRAANRARFGLIVGRIEELEVTVKSERLSVRPSAKVHQEIDSNGYFAVTKHTNRSVAGWRSIYAVQQPR